MIKDKKKKHSRRKKKKAKKKRKKERKKTITRIESHPPRQRRRRQTYRLVSSLDVGFHQCVLRQLCVRRKSVVLHQMHDAGDVEWTVRLQIQLDETLVGVVAHLHAAANNGVEILPSEQRKIN
jgi:hypothetical protein